MKKTIKQKLRKLYKRNKIRRVYLHYKLRKACKNVHIAFEAFDRPIPKRNIKKAIKEYWRA